MNLLRKQQRILGACNSMAHAALASDMSITGLTQCKISNNDGGFHILAYPMGARTKVEACNAVERVVK